MKRRGRMDDDEEMDEGDGGGDERVFRPSVEVIPMSWLVVADQDCVIQFLERQSGGSISPEAMMELLEDAMARGVDVELIMEVALAFTSKTRI